MFIGSWIRFFQKFLKSAKNIGKFDRILRHFVRKTKYKLFFVDFIAFLLSSFVEEFESRFINLFLIVHLDYIYKIFYFVWRFGFLYRNHFQRLDGLLLMSIIFILRPLHDWQNKTFCKYNLDEQ